MPLRLPTEKFAPRDHLQPFFQLWLRKIFLEDWSTKLIALAITLGLWFGISGQQTPITSRFEGVRLNFRLPSEMEISNDPQRQVRITLTGDKGRLDRLAANDLVVTADLSSSTPGEKLVELKPDNIIVALPNGVLPYGVKIDEIEPSKFLLKIEPREEREVEVKAEFEGQLPDGMVVYEDETIVAPAKVRVRGPSSFVNSIDTVTTEKIPLENRKGDFTAKQIAINLLNPKITVLDTVVDVNVTIGPKKIERILTVHAQTPLGTLENFSVVVLGPQQDLENLSPRDITISFDKVSDDTFQPKALLPESFSRSVKTKSIRPAQISLKK